MADIESNRSRLMVLQSQTQSKIDGIESAVKKGNRESNPAAGQQPGWRWIR